MNYESMSHEELVNAVSELLQQLTPEEREEILSKYGIQGEVYTEKNWPGNNPRPFKLPDVWEFESTIENA